MQVRQEAPPDPVEARRVDGRAHRLHETSRFVRETGAWYYIDGQVQGPQAE